MLKPQEVRVTNHAFQRYCERIGPIEFEALAKKVKRSRVAKKHELLQWSKGTTYLIDDDAIYILRKSKGVFVVVTVKPRFMPTVPVGHEKKLLEKFHRDYSARLEKHDDESHDGAMGSSRNW